MGELVGLVVGRADGTAVGATVGDADGSNVGSDVGVADGTAVGEVEGAALGHVPHFPKQIVSAPEPGVHGIEARRQKTGSKTVWQWKHVPHVPGQFS